MQGEAQACEHQPCEHQPCEQQACLEALGRCGVWVPCGHARAESARPGFEPCVAHSAAASAAVTTVPGAKLWSRLAAWLG